MSEGFLSRWARRKEAVRTAEQAAPAVEAEAPPLEGPAPVASPRPGGVRGGADGTAEPSPAPPPACSPQGGGGALDADPENRLAGLPSLDALTPETDLAPFLEAGVPAALRNAALRRVWSLDPAIRDFVSEAREYAYDWNTPGGVPGLGPLLPGDDVKAMLARLLRAPDAQPASLPDPEATGSEPSGESPEAGAAIADAAGDLPPPGAQPPQMPAEPTRPTAAAEPAARPRLRRHGGAMPA